MCETWRSKTSLKKIRGYSVFCKDRKIGKGEGVCIVVNNTRLKSYQITDEFVSVDSEKIWCLVNVGSENMLCGCIYL